MVNQPGAELVMEQGPSPGVKFTLAQWPVVIGRAEAAAVVIDDPHISRLHARLSQWQEGFFIENLNSINGVYLNGHRITAIHPLRSGDPVGLGLNICLRFYLLEAEVVPPPRLVISLANGTTATYTLAEPEISIGRASDNDIVISSPIVSRYHWRLSPGEVGLDIRGETNSFAKTGFDSRDHRDFPANRRPLPKPHNV